MKLNTANLFKDFEYKSPQDMPYTKPLDILCHDAHLFGYILMPSKEYEAPHPLAIMFHGFPGYTTNNDLEHALRRMGCVVIHMNHRGAWGSEGCYSFTGLIEDANEIVNWAKQEEVLEEFGIDKNNIFLVGHSMGGMTAINSLRRIEGIKGAVAIAPYDLAYCFNSKTEETLLDMIEQEGKCLRQENSATIFKNAALFYRDLSLENAYESIKDKNILFVGAEFDMIAPPEEMISPLWNKLKNHKTTAIQEYISLKTDHSLCGQRSTLAEIVGGWIEKLVSLEVEKSL